MLYILIIVFILALDIISKMYIAGNLEFFSKIPVIDGVLNITNISNDGIAFGMLGNVRWLFMLATVLLVLCLSAFMAFGKGYAKTVYISCSMILAGGLGNLIDRVFVLGVYDEPKCVVDFIDFCAFPKIWMWTFNIADVAVCVGVGLMILYLVFLEKKAQKKGFKTILYEEKKNGGEADE